MEQERPKKKLKWKAILPVIGLIIITAMAFLFIKNMNGPAQGTVSYTNQAPIKPSTASTRTYSGHAISFVYPSNFDISSTQKPNGVLDQITLLGNDRQGKQAAIEVSQESIDNDSGLNYRKSHPSLYKQGRDSQGNTVFVKTQDGSEYTGFIVHGGLVASVSLSTTFNKDLGADYNSFVKNLQWK